jgi:hypothetical protein
MASFFDQTVSAVTERPTMVYGLKFFPNLEPIVDNNQDTPAFGWPSGPEVSDCNLSVVSDVIKRLGNRCRVILEIGVHRNEGRSMTNILMDNRPVGSTYIGVDINDKSYLNDQSTGIYTIRSNSHDQQKIRAALMEIGVQQIDLLMIDGWHSVNTCVNDWAYTNLLSDHGVVILHDTNAHPGCVALFHAVDEDLFVKSRFCDDDNDMGIATFWKKS